MIMSKESNLEGKESKTTEDLIFLREIAGERDKLKVLSMATYSIARGKQRTHRKNNFAFIRKYCTPDVVYDNNTNNTEYYLFCANNKDFSSYYSCIY